MVVVGWVVVASGNSYSNRTRDRGDDNIDSGDVIVVMVKTIAVVAIYGGWWVNGGTDSGNSRSNVGGWVATVVVMILCSGRRGGGERKMIYTLGTSKLREGKRGVARACYCKRIRVCEDSKNLKSSDRIRSPPPLLWPDGGPESLRSSY
ncbi:hypothetical protein PoB_000611400 [Plakobranchus ocellatus]|uniref:Uncharacterized protein n=1 Tax=Plakobranchus ocellatus TaxID=259542 RepID=A0AAV3YBE5_9GAST|nr:hypothetical protein PoB_000611400 [Plakobranchus ocellatus]